MVDVAAIYAGLKTIAGIAKAADKIELKNQVLDLQARVFEIVEENRALQAENAEMRERLELKASVEPADGVYWLGPGRGEDSGPLCTRCYDVDGKVVRLSRDPEDGTAHCLQCKSFFVVDRSTYDRHHEALQRKNSGRRPPWA